MKTGWIVLIVVLALVGFSVMGIVGSYNNLVSKQETAKTQWSQVENVYQRRADLIPNLVNTVKGYANFEKETLTGVIEARAKATSMNINAENLSPEKLKEFQSNQTGLSSALGKLMVVVEKYPDLKANQNFMDLQAQLEGTENRCTVERQNFIKSVQDYNIYLRSIPTNIVAAIFGFEKMANFEADANAKTAPKVEF